MGREDRSVWYICKAGAEERGLKTVNFQKMIDLFVLKYSLNKICSCVMCLHNCVYMCCQFVFLQKFLKNQYVLLTAAIWTSRFVLAYDYYIFFFSIPNRRKSMPLLYRIVFAILWRYSLILLYDKTISYNMKIIVQYFKFCCRNENTI